VEKISKLKMPVKVKSEFKESKKIFWKMMNRSIKPQEKLEYVVDYENGEILYVDEKVVEKWSNFKSLLNVEHDRIANLASMGS
jgi:hypothetical protein